MSGYQKIALVGRPNVGKSALFNRIVGKRIAIVDEQEGVTRDRLFAMTEFFGKNFEVIDTGGITKDTNIPFAEQILEQTLLAIDESDALIMVVDGTIGLTSYDEEVAKILHRTKKPVCVAVNKIDNRNLEEHLFPFYSLGFPQVIAVSASQGYQIVELIEMATESLNEKEVEPVEAAIKVAIVGRPNMGKSLLLNTILGENRSVVSEIPGTTRDAIDAPIEVEGQKFLLIDTAGIRKKKGEKEVVEKFAAIRTEKAIARADVVLLVFDAQQGLTIEERKIISTVEELGKGCILLANKWDLLKATRMEHCATNLRQEASFTQAFPLIFISALTGRNLDKIFAMTKKVYTKLNSKIPTGELNRFVEKAIQRYHPPMIQGKRLRIYYLTQKGTAPIEFILFVNKKELMTLTYQKYLMKGLREAFDFEGCPIRFVLQGKKVQQARKTGAITQEV